MKQVKRAYIGLIIAVIVFSFGAFLFAQPCSSGQRGRVYKGVSRPPVRTTKMNDTKVTVAAVGSWITNTSKNVEKVEEVCKKAYQDSARVVIFPELHLVGLASHKRLMRENAERVPEGPLSQAAMEISEKYELCIVVGISEVVSDIIYNSALVVDKGEFLGTQRKINLSSDEWRFFAASDRVEVFDIGDIRFGVTICYDNHFPSIAMIHKLHDVDLIFSIHAARIFEKPEDAGPDFYAERIRAEQCKFEKLYRGRALYYNIFIVATNAVGPVDKSKEVVLPEQPGTFLAVDPSGEVILRTSAKDKFIEEVTTIELKASKRMLNHNPTRNRSYPRIKAMLNKAFEEYSY